MKYKIRDFLFAAWTTLSVGVFIASGQTSDCPRGIAVPIIKRSVYPHSTFRLGSDGRTGTETVVLGTGDRLVIKNGGCEYYVLTFRFVTSRYRHNTAYLIFWFNNAVGRINEIYPGLKAPIDIRNGALKLRSYIDTQRKKKFHKLKLGEQIIYGPDKGDPTGILQRVSVDKVQKLRHSLYALEISFSAGPL